MGKLVIIEIEELENIIDRKLSKYLSIEEQPPVLNESKVLHSIKELADFLNCSLVTAQKLKNSGDIPFIQFGRKVQFDGNAVIAAINEKKNQKKKK